MDQQKLWHDSIEDALKSCIDVLGGPKEVGHFFWPTLKADDAGRKLNHALDPERSEKLELGQVEWIFQESRRKGCHIAMHYLAGSAGYEKPSPKDPETEQAKLQREFNRRVEELDRLVISIRENSEQLSGSKC